VIDRDDGIPLLKSQAECPRQTPPIYEPSVEVAPSLMPKTLGDLALTRKASKCPKTPQECRSGYVNPVGEVSDSDSKCSLLDLSFTESLDVPFAPKTSHSVEKYMMMITLQKNPQTDSFSLANKTQVSEWPQAL
jgi:hypothetical protein